MKTWVYKLAVVFVLSFIFFRWEVVVEETRTHFDANSEIVGDFRYIYDTNIARYLALKVKYLLQKDDPNYIRLIPVPKKKIEIISFFNEQKGEK